MARGAACEPENAQIRRSPMSGLSGVGGGGFIPSAIKQFQQNLFSQIDANGDGLVSKTELEQAVTKAGGGTQAADALYSVLDPNNSGGFSEQQLAQVLPSSGFSDQMQAQMIGYQAQGWPGASSAQPGGQLAQNLFSQIDSNGDGSISQSELEQAVTKAGGTKAAADAFYAKLDPNGTGSVSEQQFAQGLASLSQSSLTQAAPHAHHHHHHGGGGGGAGAASATDDGSAGDALTSLFNADSGGAGNSPTQIAQNIFSQIDSSGTGAITQGELEQAVTAAGGSTTGADALYAKLDPNGTGSVSQQQFIDALQPPSASGNTAQDALLALLDQVNSSAPAAVAGVGGTAGGATSPINTGTTAQDALSALVQNFDPATSAASGAGNSAQDALLSLIKGSSSSDPAGTSAAGALNSADLARAFSLYQNQLEQQLMAGIGATQNAGIAA
jgi:Ca2+-binding EF-hand superfamily protein